MKYNRKKILPIIALAISTIGVGSAIFFVKISEVDATSTLMLRMFIAGGIAYALGSSRISNEFIEPQKSTKEILILLILSGIASTIDLLSNHWAVSFTSMANTAVLMNLSPFFVAFLSYIFFKERLNAHQAFSLIICITGASILFLSKNEGIDFSSNSLIGDLLALNSALFYAIYFLLIRKLRGHISTRKIIVWHSFTCGLLLLPISLTSNSPIFPSTFNGWVTIALLAFISQLLGHGLMTYALKYVDVVLASISTLAKPIVAIMLGYLFFDEKLLPLQWLGVSIVLSGIGWYRRSSSSK
ncbi:DMT family transporter [Alcaligenes aquatilis]|uniref:DMT family transporter n=1 Tax=Alcaligenes aquatilis TaxID=323284 RepID=UPI00361E42F8